MFARESRYVRVEDRVATLPPKAQSQPKVQGQPVVAFTRKEYTAQQLSNINKLAKTLKRQDDQVIYTGRQGAVEMFFVALNEQFKGRWNLPKIVLAGHSMGCIVACEALSRHPEIHYDDIVFLAAACSIAEYRRAVIPYLGQPANLTTKFYNLCLYPAVERGEKPLGKVDLIARGSLLMWIDSFLAQPESEQDRTMGRWDNCILHAGNPDIPQNVAPRVTFKAFGRGRVKDGKLIDPTEHGEFSQTTNKNLAFRFWVMSFWNAEQPGPDVIEAWPIKN